MQRTGAVNSLHTREPALSSPGVVFANRHDAGRRLAALIAEMHLEEPLVVGIPRGGVPVAAEVARVIEAPLDIVVVRKVGAPQNPEFALGALAEPDVSVIDIETVRRLGIDAAELDDVVDRARAELSERMTRYRANQPPLPVIGRTILLVDDGLATGRTAQAAASSLRKRDAARIVLAVPVASPESVNRLGELVDEVVCVEMPEDLWAIGFWYEDFSPTSDDEVAALLAERSVTQGPSTAHIPSAAAGQPPGVESIEGPAPTENSSVPTD